MINQVYGGAVPTYACCLCVFVLPVCQHSIVAAHSGMSTLTTTDRLAYSIAPLLKHEGWLHVDGLGEHEEACLRMGF